MKLSREMIEHIEVFANIKEVTKDKLAQIGQIKTLKKNEVLFQNLEIISSIYVVVTGKVALLRYCANGQKRVFFILGEGSMINEVVFDEMHVSVDCECFEEAVLLYFDKAQLLEVMKSDFELTLNILNSSGKKQRRLFRQLKNTVQIKIDKKLAAKLWKLAKDHGIQTEEEGWKSIQLKFNVTYLSYMMGVPRETISRALSELSDKGFIKWVDKCLWIEEKKILNYYRKA